MATRYSARRLKRARHEAGVTIGEAAKRMRLQRKHLAMLEEGVSVPKADTLAKIADAYAVPITFFFEGAA